MTKMSEPKRILYRGVPMIEGWPEKTFAAQQSPSYAFCGQDVGRVRNGDKHDDWEAYGTIPRRSEGGLK
jgi:hypothetical protein